MTTTKSSKATTKRPKTTSNLGIIRMVAGPETATPDAVIQPHPAVHHPGSMMSLLAAAAGATSSVAVM